MDIDNERILKQFFAVYFVAWMALTARHPIGRNIFDEEWELAIILDACRVDALREVETEYDFIEEVQSSISVGSSSKEWMVNTFHSDYEEQLSKTAYLTGNGWTNSVFEDNVEFSDWTITQETWANDNALVEWLLHRPTITEEGLLEFIHQPMSNVGGVNAFPATQLTDFTIKSGREHDAERTLVHYMQPHTPYLHRVEKGESVGQIDTDPLSLIGDDRDEEVWQAYLNNLRYVLDQVEVLLENFDAENVLITADHGEMFGPPPLVGHAEGIPHPRLKQVPWVTTTGNDTQSRKAEIEFPDNEVDDTEDRLAALGYL